MGTDFIVLTGMKHCGKTTNGKALAAELGVPFFDIDDEIMSVSGKTPRQLYDEGGAQLFRRFEELACRTLADRFTENGAGADKTSGVFRAVVAAGGGICDNPGAMDVLKTHGLVIYMKADEEVVFTRIMKSAEKDGRLPSYIAAEHPKNEEEIRTVFHRFYTARCARYDILADKIVHVREQPSEEVVRAIMKVIHEYNTEYI